MQIVLIVLNRLLDKDGASSIEILQNLLKDISKKLKKTTHFLTETVNKIRFVESKISSPTGSKIETLNTNSKFCLERNTGLEIISKVALVLEGQQ